MMTLSRVREFVTGLLDLGPAIQKSETRTPPGECSTSLSLPRCAEKLVDFWYLLDTLMFLEFNTSHNLSLKCFSSSQVGKVPRIELALWRWSRSLEGADDHELHMGRANIKRHQIYLDQMCLIAWFFLLHWGTIVQKHSPVESTLQYSIQVAPNYRGFGSF